MKSIYKQIAILILLISVSFCGYCQSCKEENSTAFFKIPYPFIYIRPIVLQLSRSAIIDYSFDFYNTERRIKPIDSLVLFDMIANQKNDTTDWNENEIRNCFLVKSLPVNFTEVQLKLSPKYDTSSIRRFVNLIKKSNDINYGDDSKLIISAMSKPEYDRTKTFALIEYDLFNSHLEGIKLIKLFKLQNFEWKEIEIVVEQHRMLVF